MSLAGRAALVTGSSRGIGLAVAHKLAAEGARVVVHGRTASPALDRALGALKEAGAEAAAVTGDLRRPEQVEAMVAEAAAAFGGLHVLVNSAAMASFAPALDLSLKQWDATLSASLRGPWLVVKAAAQHMGEGWGRIVNVSSLGSRRYLPGYGAMGAAKAGLESLTRTLAVELLPRGIVVNAVVGGMITTESERAFPPEIMRMREAYLRSSPSRRVGLPEELADAVALLCREEARWIVGQTLVADGGFSLI